MVNRSGVKRDAGLLDSWQAKKPRSLPEKDEAATTPQKVSPKPMHISAAEPPPTVKKETNSKFHPLPIPKGVKHDVPVVDGVVPRGASILIIQDPWINRILDGHKTLEIRGQLCKKPKGEHVYLALSGGGGIILGRVTFVQCHGPLPRKRYAELSSKHCVSGESLPYGSSTYAWEFKAPVRFRRPVPYLHKQGVVVWAKKE